jgi:Transglutaminase-like superfamily/Domain of Unknown Function with PDB structure (DUF3857)
MWKNLKGIFLSIALIPWGNVSAESYDPPYQHEKINRFVSVDERGRYTETVERISRIMNDYGVDRYSRHSFDHKTTQETLKILQAENRLPSGKILRLEKDWIKGSDGGRKDGRNFDDVKTTTVVFPESVVGSLLYSKHVLKHFKPEKPGEFQLKYSLSPHIVFKEIVTTVRLPKSLNVLINNNGFTGGVIHESKKYITYQYTIQQDIAYKREDSSADNEDYSPYIIFTQAKDYIDIGRNYHRGAAPKVRVTQEIKRLATELTAQASTDEEKAKALYIWVSKNIRYISTTVDDGGLVPRDSNYILSRRFGDCKDHVVLLEALLRAVGIESTAALVNLGEAFELQAGPAAISPINHVITYIPSMDLYLDSTAQFVPFGRLDDQVIDKPTVLVSLNRLGRTPKMRAEDNSLYSHTTMTLKADGSIVGKNASALSGTMEINSRLARFSEQTEPMEKTVNDLLFRFNEIGSGQITYTPPKNIDAAFTWSSNFTLDAITDLSRAGAFTIPVGVAPGYLPATTIYKPLEKRKFPYICDSLTTEDRYSITLPDHITIDSMPINVQYFSDNAQYQSTYTLDGNQIEVSRKLVFQFPSRKCSQDMYPELLEVIRVIRADHRSPVVFSMKNSK